MLTEQQDQIIKNASNNQREYDDNVKCFLTFGHLFNYNPLACMSQTYCIHGKPALNADAMVGIVRKWIDPATGQKVCAMMKAETLTPEYDDQGNVNPNTVGVRYVAMRTDELMMSKQYGIEAPVHTWTFTMQDAMLRNNHKNRTWREMPLVMCGKRAATALCRVAFPDVVGTANSPDELAEQMLQDADEVERIAYASNGERIPYDLKKKSNVSQPPAIQPAPQPAPQPKPTATKFHLRDFTDILTVTDELVKEGICLDDALKALDVYGDGVRLPKMNETHFRRFFYPIMFSPLRLIVKDGRLPSFTKEGLKDVDTDSLAAMFDSFYGTCYDKKRDGDLEGYCVNVIKWSNSPWFSELAHHTQKLLAKDLINEEVQEDIIHTMIQDENLFNQSMYDDIMMTLPSLD